MSLVPGMGNIPEPNPWVCMSEYQYKKREKVKLLYKNLILVLFCLEAMRKIPYKSTSEVKNHRVPFM